ncbi:3'-5' exoribonuclease YhaM [Aquisphaera giovannonii]|uniref:3'-5' exoribonuclease YhaM n=1 Tax=Aquisphaera giovannonii TaxID=406548 RepID=A0A5B9W1G9_9BACT|nr:HD domain-containing protein [Aquisphaera giovannonii]QEH34041.1 3'-5' exoribonuclease YhaM [Aquisphaera giovannonii]
MAIGSVVIRLSDLVDAQEAVCYAALVKKHKGMTARNQPFIRCMFRDRRVQYESMLWHDHRFFEAAAGWTEGQAYRLEVRGKHDLRYGMQIEILGIRPATDDDEADGYDFFDLVESSRYEPKTLMQAIRNRIDRFITQPHLRELVLRILDEHEKLFTKIQAAQAMHHSYTAGLLEHVWSMSRVAESLIQHYSSYYSDLNPPLDKGVVMAAVILHDIGKLRELQYNPVEARYTKEGRLIGHILIGRDMVRDVARTIDGFPEETLLLLEHAILAHHGRHEYGAPVLPQTAEALLVNFIDELDAKMNIVARQRMQSNTLDEFTDKVYGLDNRRIYKGIPDEPGSVDAGPPPA